MKTVQLEEASGTSVHAHRPRQCFIASVVKSCHVPQLPPAEALRVGRLISFALREPHLASRQILAGVEPSIEGIRLVVLVLFLQDRKLAALAAEGAGKLCPCSGVRDSASDTGRALRFRLVGSLGQR